jgi:hypothetical protein
VLKCMCLYWLVFIIKRVYRILQERVKPLGSLKRQLHLAFVPSSVPILDSSSDDESEDENPPLPTDTPPDESFEPEQAPVPPLTIWVRSTREATGDLVGDPSNQRRTHSRFQRASSLLAQVSESHDPKTFA